MSVVHDIKRAIWTAALLRGGPVYLMDLETRWEKESDASHSYRKTQEVMEALWKKSRNDYNYKMCMTFGQADDNSYWDVYGGHPDFSSSMCEKFITDIQAGIDWEKTSELQDHIEERFNGTFSPNTPIPVVRGFLHLKSEVIYPWMANFNVNLSGLNGLLSVIQKLEGKTDEEIIQQVCARFEEAVTGDFNKVMYYHAY